MADRESSRSENTQQSAAAGSGESGGSRGGTATKEVTRSESEGRQRGRWLARRGRPWDIDRFGVPDYWSGSFTPFSLMRRMVDEMDRIFESFGFGRSLTPGAGFLPLGDTGLLSGAWVPAIETFERGDDFIVRAELPGVSKDDVNVEIEDDMLTISGERRQDFEDRGEGYYRSERRYGAFSRTISLPEGVDPDEVTATFRDGVLEVTIPRPHDERSKRRRVKIR